MKIKSKISILLGGFLLSSVALSNVMAEETSWLNTHDFITGESLRLYHGSPEYPGSIVVQLIDESIDGIEAEPMVDEIISQFQLREDHALTSVVVCLRNPESAPPFAINIYKLDVPTEDLVDPKSKYTLFQTSGEPVSADAYCTVIPLEPPIEPTDETLLLGISFDFELPLALPAPGEVVALDSELPMSAIISAVGLGQTSTYLMIDDCNTFVSDIEFGDGRLLSGVIAECAVNAKNHGKFVSCVTKAANTLKKQRVISGKEKGKITRCAAKSSVGK